MFSIEIDVHRNILSAQCSVKWNLQTINNVKAALTKHHLSINFYKECEVLHAYKILIPENLFIPSSVLVQDSSNVETTLEDDILTISRNCFNPNLTITDKLQFSEKKCFQSNNENMYNPKQEDDIGVKKLEINFRIQISNGDLIPVSSLQYQGENSLLDFYKAQIQCQELYQVMCTNCDTLLSTCPVSFHKIHEYCDSFSDLSESWFCHKKIALKCELQKNSLLVSETCIFLHSSICDSFSLDTCDKEIKCKACSTVLSCGSVSKSVGPHLKRFYADAVMLIKPASKPCNSEEYYRNIVPLSLWTIINQKSYTCRILFQSKVEGTDQCLLLWIPPTKVAKFKLQSAVPSQPTPVSFSTQDVYEVQYYVGTLSSPLVKQWSKDFNVDFYQVGSSFLLTLKKQLISNNDGKATSSEFSSSYLSCDLPLLAS